MREAHAEQVAVLVHLEFVANHLDAGNQHIDELRKGHVIGGLYDFEDGAWVLPVSAGVQRHEQRCTHRVLHSLPDVQEDGPVMLLHVVRHLRIACRIRRRFGAAFCVFFCM